MVMANWLSILEEFQVYEPAPTSAKGHVPALEPNPKAILFDVYGTLVCPRVGDLDEQAKLVSGEESFIKTAERFGFSEEMGIKWHKWFFEAISSEHKEQKKKGIAPAEVLVDRIWAEMIARAGGDLTISPPRMVAAYRELLANPIRPFSGAAEALLKLKKNGIVLGLASNSQFYTLPILAKVLGIKPEEYFEAELTFLSFRLGFSKPSPYFFRLVRTRALSLGLRPEEVLIVGNDCENDILPATAHGLQTLLFWGNAESVRMGRVTHQGPMVTNYEALLKACGM
jgi:putative hydrolase of the HAD superfamily